LVKIYIPKLDGDMYADQIKELQRKVGVYYIMPTLTSCTEKLGKKDKIDHPA